MTARLLYENHLVNATSIVASSEADGFPVANIADYIPTDYFRSAASGTINIDVQMPSPVTADSFGFYNQDIFAGAGTIRLQYWTGSAYADCFAAVTPADNTPVLKTFTARTTDKWRIVITSGAVVNLGIAFFGRKLDLPYGNYLNWTPPLWARNTSVLNSISDAGVFLGRSITALGIKTTLVLQYASDDYIYTSWLPFMKHAEQKPFFFQPHVEAYPGEVAFCWTENGVGNPSHTQYGYGGASTSIMGLVE